MALSWSLSKAEREFGVRTFIVQENSPLSLITFLPYKPWTSGYVAPVIG
jgi:hypothetical protein